MIATALTTAALTAAEQQQGLSALDSPGVRVFRLPALKTQDARISDLAVLDLDRARDGGNLRPSIRSFQDSTQIGQERLADLPRR